MNLKLALKLLDSWSWCRLRSEYQVLIDGDYHLLLISQISFCLSGEAGLWVPQQSEWWQNESHFFRRCNRTGSLIFCCIRQSCRYSERWKYFHWGVFILYVTWGWWIFRAPSWSTKTYSPPFIVNNQVHVHAENEQLWSLAGLKKKTYEPPTPSKKKNHTVPPRVTPPQIHPPPGARLCCARSIRDSSRSFSLRNRTLFGTDSITV